jgi:hypothetical protein
VLRLLLFSALLLFFESFSAEAATPPQLIWARRLDSNGQLLVQTYGLSSTTSLSFSDLEFPPSIFNKNDPLEIIYDDTPDWRIELLKRGLARLKNEALAAPNLRDAQESARVRGLGLWEKVSPTQTLDGQGESARAQPFFTRARIIEWIKFYGGLGAVFALLVVCLRFLLRLLRKRRLYLILLGPQSTGKTWMWIRLQNPDISRHEFKKIQERSRGLEVKRSPTVEPLGRYEVQPVYIAVPGAAPGVHLMQMLRKRFWSPPAKYIWIITLATTPDSSVNCDSPEALKIDSNYIAEQLGYLSLPLSVLQAPRFPKPEMLIAIIAKFDLFSGQEPNHPASASAVATLDAIFAPHIALLKEHCKKKIPFAVERCSALEGWRVDAVARHIKRSVFRG